MRKVEEQVIVVDADGVLVAAVGEGESVSFHCKDTYKLAAVKNAVKQKSMVALRFRGPLVEANTDSMLGIYAALQCAAPGRTILKEAPEELVNILSTH